MSGITGIELGPDSCVLVRASRRGGVLELSAAHVIDPSAWPAQEAIAAELLKRVRREQGFPRTARVIAWGVAEGASPRDPATRVALRPLITAGFWIQSVISPAQALAILAATRPRRGSGASAWLAINRHSAAIAIVRGMELLYSRAFGWNWDTAAIGSQAQLLQRYSIVAHLAPEIRRAAEIVRTKFGVPLESAVTCGDLHDLRSLTMPLIDELDLEVETLDSAEGLYFPPAARRDQLPDSLSAVRLACAAAAGPAIRGSEIDLVRLARAAALLAAVGGVGWAGYVWLAGPQPAAVSSRTAAAAPDDPQDTAPDQPRQVPAPAPPQSTISPASAAAPLPSPASPRSGSPDSTAPPTARPLAASADSSPSDRTSPVVAIPQTAPASVTGAERPRPARPASASTDARRVRQRPQGQGPGPAATGRMPRTAPPRSDVPAPVSRGTRTAPLKDPLPVIDTILVSSDRRLAVIDGAAVSVGDTVGTRRIARIEVDAVIFREPSGREIRVPIRVRRAP